MPEPRHLFISFRSTKLPVAFSHLVTVVTKVNPLHLVPWLLPGTTTLAMLSWFRFTGKQIWFQSFYIFKLVIKYIFYKFLKFSFRIFTLKPQIKQSPPSQCSGAPTYITSFNFYSDTWYRRVKRSKWGLRNFWGFGAYIMLVFVMDYWQLATIICSNHPHHP